MVRLSTAQRIKLFSCSREITIQYNCISKCYVKYDKFNLSTEQTFYNIVKKFEETRSISDRIWLVHHRRVRSAKNIAAVTE